jgi:hypothetical protein
MQGFMSKKSANYVKMDVPSQVYQRLQEMARTEGKTMEALLVEAVSQMYEAAVHAPVWRRPTPEQLEQDFLEASLDEDRLELIREWDETLGDGLSDK